ncbi:hypothetical protein ES706_00529 [subsurface metagenome]
MLDLLPPHAHLAVLAPGRRGRQVEDLLGQREYGRDAARVNLSPHLGDLEREKPLREISMLGREVQQRAAHHGPEIVLLEEVGVAVELHLVVIWNLLGGPAGFVVDDVVFSVCRLHQSIEPPRHGDAGGRVDCSQGMAGVHEGAAHGEPFGQIRVPDELLHVIFDHGVNLGGDAGEDGGRRAKAPGDPEAEGAVEGRLEAGHSEPDGFVHEISR